MYRKTGLLLALGLSIVGALPGMAQNRWTDSATVGTRTGAATSVSTKFKIWVPAGVTAPKAALLVSGAQEAMLRRSMPLSQQPRIRAAATAEQMVLITFHTAGADTGIVHGFNPTLAHQDSLAKAMAGLAQRTGISTLSSLPVIAMGHGRGAGFAQEYGMFAPTTTAAVISYHPRRIANPAWRNQAPYTPATNSLTTVPHALVSGEVEGPDFRNNLGGFLADTIRTATLAQRAAGALAHQVLEMSGSHNYIDPRGMAYLAVFMQKTAQLRIAANGTVNAIAANTGFLGTATNPLSFESTSYSAAAFSQAVAATRHWLYDADHGRAWVAFHQTPIRTTLQPPALAVAPYVSGRNPSGIAMTYDLVGANFAQFGDSNVIRIEMSNAWGDFNDAQYPGLYQAGAKRRDTTGYTAAGAAGNLGGFIEAALSNNLQYDRITFGTNPRPRYRFRIVTTHPALQSNATPEVVEWIYGTRQNMWLSALPGGTKLEKGKEVRLTLNRQNTFNTAAGNRFTIQLSDSTGSFDNPTVIGDTAAVFTANSINLRGVVPANALEGYRYRVRVKSSAPLDSSGNNGGDLDLVGDIVSLGSFLAKTVEQVVVYPNPAQESAVVVLDMASAGRVSYTLINTAGVQVLKGEVQKPAGVYNLPLNLKEIPAGVYTLSLQMGNGVKTARVMKQ